MKLNFSLFKNNHKENDKHPDYIASTFDKETGTSTKIGAGWLKTGKSGVKFISIALDDEWKPEGKVTTGGTVAEQSRKAFAELPERGISKEDEEEARIKADDIPF